MRKNSAFVRVLLLACATVAHLGFVSQPVAALSSFLWATDDAGAAVEGSCTIEGREGSVEVLALDHSVYIPVDSATGDLTGTRYHQPIVITKRIDKTSPWLHSAVCQGRRLLQVRLASYRIDDTGTEVEYFNCVLENVKVQSVETFLDNVRDIGKSRMPLERVVLLYDKVTWTFVDGNLQASDSPPVSR